MYETLRAVRDRLETFVGDLDPASPRGRKRARILAAATELFVAQGYRKTNIDEIARAAGIAKGTVYLYFANKSEVLLAATTAEKLRSLTRLEDVFAAGLSPRERLRRWVRATFLLVSDSPLLTRFAAGDAEFQALLADLDPQFMTAAFAELDAFLGELLDAAAHPRCLGPEERAERIAVLSALRSFAPTIRSEHVRRGMSVERFADAMATALVEGLCPTGTA